MDFKLKFKSDFCLGITGQVFSSEMNFEIGLLGRTMEERRENQIAWSRPMKRKREGELVDHGVAGLRLAGGTGNSQGCGGQSNSGKGERPLVAGVMAAT